MSNYNFSIMDKNVDPDLEIDFLDLQPAVAMQSSLYGYYSDLAVDARAERDAAVNELDRMTAATELEIRETAQAKGEKLTEGKVSSLVESDSRIVAQKAIVVEKNKTMQKAESKVRALDQKRSMIECAVRMTLSKSNGMSQNGVTEEWSNEESTRAIRGQLNRR